MRLICGTGNSSLQMVFSTGYSVMGTRFWFKSLYLKAYTAEKLTDEFSEQSWVHCTRSVTAKQPGLQPGGLPCLWLMQEQAYKTAVCDTADLKQRVIETWSSIPQTVIDEAIDEWGLRPRACAKAKGRHVGHLLWLTGSFQSHPHLTKK